ncbi:MAG: UbiX family flavin prenyltransferase, partial [Planctomycetota bacterium]
MSLPLVVGVTGASGAPYAKRFIERVPLVVGVTGASGAPYAKRFIERATEFGVPVHLVVSDLGRRLLAEELDLKRLDPDELSGGRGSMLTLHNGGRGSMLTLHNDRDTGAPPGSGSFRHRGMAIVPCSGNTLGRIAAGITDNLVQRAAAVTLKERRRLVIAHRESPLSMIEIDAMAKVTAAGAIVLPLAPGFYLRPKSIDDLLD